MLAACRCRWRLGIKSLVSCKSTRSHGTAGIESTCRCSTLIGVMYLDLLGLLLGTIRGSSRALRFRLSLFSVLCMICNNALCFHGTNRDFELPIPNPKADVIVVGKILGCRVAELAIDIAIVDTLDGTLSSQKLGKCRKQYRNTSAIAISTSIIPDECDNPHEEYLLSLNTSDATACPSLMHDGNYRPLLPAYYSQGKTRFRRQDSICK